MLLASAKLAVVAALALTACAAAAQEPQPALPPQNLAGPSATPAVQPAPQRQPGFLESFGRWMDEAGAGMRKNADQMWRGMGGVGNSAGSAAKGTADAAATVAKGAADATKGTVDVLGRLGSARLVTGRERCPIAPNGAPDCKLAAEAMCKGQGFSTGNSIDYQTAEQCPPQAFAAGRKPAPGECPVEHVVTKAMCQQ
jgi:hypothetical protein